jgi:multicomponent Na+:H+ antiporter subunit E
MTTLGFGAVLVAIWVLLWGSASPANVLSGIAVAAILIYAVPGIRRRGGPLVVRPVAVLRLVGRVLRTTVQANVVLAREVLTRESHIRTGIVAVPLPPCSEELVTLIANLLALAPGTMPLEVETEPNVLYVHILHLHDIERARRDIQGLTADAVRAFGSKAAVAALDNTPSSGGRGP